MTPDGERGNSHQPQQDKDHDQRQDGALLLGIGEQISRRLMGHDVDGDDHARQKIAEHQQCRSDGDGMAQKREGFHGRGVYHLMNGLS